MRALLLFEFVTIALSLSATAHENSKLQRRDVSGNGVDDLGISNHDLSFVFTANTSNANSLDWNSKRAADDPGHPPQEETKMFKTDLTVLDGRFTGTVTFGHHAMSGVVYDTNSQMTWIKAKHAAPKIKPPPFKCMGFYELDGSEAKAAVTVNELPVSDMAFRMVQPEVVTAGYDGGLSLERSSISWPNHVGDLQDVFAFLSEGPHHVEFHMSKFYPVLHYLLYRYPVKPQKRKWILETGRITVNGVKLKIPKLITYFDTGVPYIYGSLHSVEEVYKTIGKSRMFNGFWTVPCSQKPVVSFSWHGSNRKFPIDDFFVGGGVGGKVDNEEYCLGVIRPLRVLPDDEFVLGTGFFYKKHIAFFRRRNMIGIANLEK